MAEEGLGSLDGGLQDPEMEETKPPDGPDFAPVKLQPCNQATMMCLRGPCIHLWRLLLRFDSAVKDVMSERSWTCLASPREEFDLNDRLIYFCDRWWPRAPLLDDEGEEWDHESIPLFTDIGELIAAGVDSSAVQGRLRKRLHELWETGLAEMGYDFSWREFDGETFHVDDDPHQRQFSAPGGLDAAREAKEAAELPPAGSIPEDDQPLPKTPEEEAAEAEAEYIHQMLLKRKEEEGW